MATAPTIGLLSCLALLACAPAAPPAQSERATAHAGAPADAADIAGAWDVARFEDHVPRRLSGPNRAAFADFGPGGVGLRLECNHSGRAGTVTAGRFLRAEENDGLQTAMSCGPERNARESRYFNFFEQNPAIERLGPDRLRLTAGTTELILERPALRRQGFVPAPAELEGEWQMVGLTRYDPAGGYSGIGLSETPGRIVFAGGRLFYSRCPQFGVSFRWGEGGKLIKTGGDDMPGDVRACRELREPVPLPALPAASELLRLLHSNPEVEHAGEGSLLISTERLGLLLTRAR